MEKKTHREVKNPQITARFLADYMAASEQAKRTIVRDCKYRPIARLLQHDEAKIAVAKHIRSGGDDTTALSDAAQKLRDRIADDSFERSLYDSNADYIDRFAKVSGDLVLPDAELLVPGKGVALSMADVKVTSEIHFRLRRLTKTNKVRVGAAMLRYGKNKALSPDVAEWQSAFLFGLLGVVPPEDGAQAEHKLCLTVDAYAGKAYEAPTNAAQRFKNMEAACASIAERWPNIKPPPNAVL